MANSTRSRQRTGSQARPQGLPDRPHNTRDGGDDPDQQFFENSRCGSERNYTGYCNAELEALFVEQSTRRASSTIAAARHPRNGLGCAIVVPEAEVVVRQVAQMSDAEQPTPELYREAAERLRQLAAGSRLPDIVGDLLDLSARFERMAVYLEAAKRPDIPRGSRAD